MDGYCFILRNNCYVDFVKSTFDKIDITYIYTNSLHLHMLCYSRELASSTCLSQIHIFAIYELLAPGSGQIPGTAPAGDQAKLNNF